MSTAAEPTPTPAQPGPARPRTGPGCLAKVAIFVAMLVIGGVVAHLVRGNDGTPTTTVAEGQAGAVGWELRGRVDPADGERCLELHQGSLDYALTGVCLPARNQPTGTDLQETSPAGTDRWVLFGPAPASADQVRLALSDGSEETVAVRRPDGWDDRFYVFVPDEDGVRAGGPAAFLDPEGQAAG